MLVPLSAREILNIAINIERSGIAFYDIMSRSTENRAARGVFRQLADIEREHIQTFQKMLNEADKYPAKKTRQSVEQTNYLKTLAESAAFTDDLITSQTASRVKSDLEAVELAISAEKDAILFYYEIKETLPRRVHPIINKIIAEEKQHLKQIFALKERLSSATD